MRHTNDATHVFSLFKATWKKKNLLAIINIPGFTPLLLFFFTPLIPTQVKPNINKHAHRVFSSTVCEVCSGRSEHSGCPEDSTKVTQACFSMWTP